MKGKKVVITGIPGVGKTTVITGAIENLMNEGIPFQSINFGTFMFEMAEKEELVKDRDQMRTLDRSIQKELQARAAENIRNIDGNVIVDTHASVKTSQGFLAGLPQWVLQALSPDSIVLVEADCDQILLRRLSDESRTRDMEGSRSIEDHQQFNRSIAAAYSAMSGCTVIIVKNHNGLLNQAVEDLVKAIR